MFPVRTNMIITTRGHYDSTSTTNLVTWHAVLEWLRQCAGVPEAHKTSLRLFAFADFGGKAKKDDVTEVHALVLDYDSVTEEQADQVLAFAAQHSAFAYTSHSHGVKPGVRFRVLFELDKPCPVAAWSTLWLAICARIGVTADKNCKHPSAVYYAPATNPAAGVPCWFETYSGSCLRVDDLLAEASETLIRELEDSVEDDLDQGELISCAELALLANKLTRKQNQELQVLGRALRKALVGEAFANAGNRNTLTYKLAGEIAKEYPRAAAGPIREIFTCALNLQGEPSPKAFESQLKRHQAEQQKIAKTRAALTLFQTSDDAPAPNALPLIVQKEGFYWVRDLQGHDFRHAFSNKDISLGLLRLFPQHMRNVRGEVLTLEQATQAWSVPAKRILSDYEATENTWDAITHTLTLATAKRVQVEPCFHEDLDLWLRSLAGEKYDLLVTWLRGLDRLDKPAPAVYFHGFAGAGKGLFANAVAALWEEPIILFPQILAGFDAQLAGTPIVFSDEELPPECSFAYLRSFLTTCRRKVNEKFKPLFELRGHPRLIVAANNFDILGNGGGRNLTNEDAEAIALRFLPIRCRPETVKLLETLKGETFIWKMPQYVAWLRQTMGPLIVPDRFVAQAKNTEIILKLASNRYAWFMQFLLSYLHEPRTFELRYAGGQGAWSLRVTQEGEFLVSGAAYAFFTAGDARTKISDAEFRRALRYFAQGERRHLRQPGSSGTVQTWYYAIDLDKLLSCAEDFDVDAVHETLVRSTEDRLQMKKAPV